MEKNYSNCERALQIDPRNVRALSISAFQTGYRIITGRSSDVHGDTARVGELADRALQVDPNYYLAHHAKAYDHMLSARWHEVVVEEERALALNPVYIGAFMPMFIATLKLNQFDKTVELADKAIRFSPRDPILFVIYSYKGQALFLLRKFDPAIEWLDKSVAANTFYPNSQAILAAAFAMAGRNEEAHLQMVRYLARGDVHIKTIRQVESVPPLSFPLILEGLRKAGMPEQ
jgi:tetratricopeptide (TPR) repeat protein